MWVCVLPLNITALVHKHLRRGLSSGDFLRRAFIDGVTRCNHTSVDLISKLPSFANSLSLAGMFQFR